MLNFKNQNVYLSVIYSKTCVPLKWEWCGQMLATVNLKKKAVVLIWQTAWNDGQSSIENHYEVPNWD